MRRLGLEQCWENLAPREREVLRHVLKGLRNKQITYAMNIDELSSIAELGKAAAVFVTSQDSDAAKAQALTLHELYPELNVYVRVRTLAEQDELVAKGIKHAGTGYIESTLVRGGILLKDLGVSDHEVSELVSTLRDDDYALIRAAHNKG